MNVSVSERWLHKLEGQLIAAYLRLSLEDVETRQEKADESNSIINQRSIVMQYIQNHPDFENKKIVEFVDDGYTGTNFDRPNFKHMMDMVRSGEICCIVVKDLSRFARNYIDSGEYLEHIFPLLKVRFIAINDGYDSNKYIGTTGGMDVAFRNYMHQLYSADISKKVKATQHMLMKKGKYVSHCPYGYTKPKGQKHQMIPDPVTAPIVRNIFLWAIEGKKSTEIARILNERGIPTPMQSKKTKKHKNMTNDVMWSHQAVIRIIKDYKYTGAMVSFKCYNKTIRAKAQTRNAPEDYVINEDMHEAIVSHDEYYAANDALRKVKNHVKVHSDRRDRVYYCGYCGRRLRKTFGTDEYYSCTTPLYIKGAPCTGIRWSRTAIEEIVFSTYKRQLQLISEQYEKEKTNQRPSMIPSLKTRHKSIAVQIKGISGEVATLYEKYRSANITREEFIRRKSQLSVEKDKLQIELSTIEADIEQAVIEERKEAESLQAMKDIVSLSEIDDTALLSRMYDDIEKVVVLDNSSLDIIWKFDVDFGKYYP